MIFNEGAKLPSNRTKQQTKSFIHQKFKKNFNSLSDLIQTIIKKIPEARV
jgi:hypothetical protein